MELLPFLGYVIAGTLLSSLLSLFPPVHIYNVAGIIIILFGGLSQYVDPFGFSIFMMSLVVGFSFLNTVPGIFWGTPDESTAFLVLPSSKYLMQGRGYEAAVLTGVGSLGGVLFLMLVTPLILTVVPPLRTLLQPHMGWLLMTIIAYMLLSEWPKSTDRAPTRLGRFLDAYTSIGAGLLTFLLAAFLGFIVTSKNIVPLSVSFQGIMPAFVGLFAVPWVLGNIISRTQVPVQHVQETLDIDGKLICKGVASGGLGGFIAALFPIVTAGIGSLLAGHATAQRDDRIFILSYGTAKVVYYVGSFLLFFAPGLYLTRGGMAIMMNPIYRPVDPQDYFVALACIAVSGFLSFLLLIFFSRLSIQVIHKVDYRMLSWFALGLILLVVGGLTGVWGLAVMTVGAAIGWIPVLFNSRRSNCMGILLLPIALYMMDYQPAIMRFLGLD